MRQVIGLMAALMLLAGCGGMTRAVTTVPNTMDDLAAKSAALRGEPPPPKPAG